MTLCECPGQWLDSSKISILCFCSKAINAFPDSLPAIVPYLICVRATCCRGPVSHKWHQQQAFTATHHPIHTTTKVYNQETHQVLQ